jgi:hypothetical protein
MKQKIINFVKNSLPLYIVGALIPISVFNVVSGCFWSNDSWQTSTGVFQMLFAIEFISNKFD